MFFVLSKILFYILMPIAWILFFLFVSLFTKNDRRRKRSLITATVLLLFFTNPIIGNEAMLLLEHPPTPFSKLQKHDAVIILTGITNQQKSPMDRVYMNHGADRVLIPLKMYKEGYVKKIIISGGSGSLMKRKSLEADELKGLLIQSGVPEDVILVENRSRNTHENALYTKQLLQMHPQLKSLLLVTSAFHMPRSAGCFKKQLINAEPFSTDFYSTDRSYHLDDIVPQEKYLAHWQVLFHEMLGYLVYKIMRYC